MTGELGRLIARRIALTGPISLADFMAEALGHPRLGYYRRALPVGAAGDFTTAPEISQMFGELLGAWLAERWLAMGRPPSFRLVELGPGRGTLMADALRATRAVPGFHAAIDLHLVEINEQLRALQGQALAAFKPTWHARFDDVPEGPLLLVANEFFDALPVHQFVRLNGRWHERMVSVDGDDLTFAATPDPVPDSIIPAHLRDAPEGAVFETSPASQAIAHDIAGRIAEGRPWQVSATRLYRSLGERSLRWSSSDESSGGQSGRLDARSSTTLI